MTSDVSQHSWKMPAMVSRAGAPLTTNVPYWEVVVAFGALWGGLEITLGSLLRALHLPIAGTLLAAVASFLLVAERQIFPYRGLSLATASAAALCKVFCPGGATLGPMLGILVEGVLVEIALLLASRLALPAALAGSLCSLWALVQAAVMRHLFLSPTNLDLNEVLLRKAEECFGHTQAGVWCVPALLALAAVLGAVFGVLGWSLGRQASDPKRVGC